MKIQTLKDLKNALKDVPDEFLEDFGWGANLESDGEIELLVWCDESDFEEQWEELRKKYPQIQDIVKLIDNIVKASIIVHEQNQDDHSIFEREEAISSEDKI